MEHHITITHVTAEESLAAIPFPSAAAKLAGWYAHPEGQDAMSSKVAGPFSTEDEAKAAASRWTAYAAEVSAELRDRADLVGTDFGRHYLRAGFRKEIPARFVAREMIETAEGRTISSLSSDLG